MNETGFGFALQEIYISFSGIYSALSRCGVSFILGAFSSLITAVTSTFGIFPGRVFIRKFYYTFVNRFCDFHTLKNVNSFLKRNIFAIKALNIGFFRSDIRLAVLKNIVQFSCINFIS